LTLIGRLLYESKLLFDDQLDALAKASRFMSGIGTYRQLRSHR